ncbi:SDR family NAD(P)-dependent oxidoreductase [Formicincola oecophyllae]|uniref:SDR family NAD(P)-dependent oxidoreductase n=1 Tax=Formicincola oecophyllae TaxID=2558361 RepID=A0A4Y6U9J9_9PROT|nr:SDR family NAD(P)-dependent oxidoreductase [Formicincola oecophyllae]QDH14149.1 SDR family NAD(P)-dependent oxidoreductase [Formicincola oecophyllae]
MTETTSPSGKDVRHHILITGGSSGIGAALAELYARPGVAITLWGRNQERLQKTAEACRAKGALAEGVVVDLTNPEAAVEAFIRADSERPVDVLINSAGLADIRPEGALTEPAEQAIAMSQVNFTTPVALGCEAGERMARRGYGRIAFLGSVASFHDLPLATVYAGSKAGLGRFSTALHAALHPHNVAVTLIAPGFIDTPMSQRLEGDQPLLVPVPVAARKIKRAIDQGRATLVFPWAFQLTRFVEAILPRPFVHFVLRKLDVMQHPSTH